MNRVYYIITRNGHEVSKERYTGYKDVVARCEQLKERSKGFSHYSFNTHYEEFDPEYNKPTAKDRERNLRGILAH